MDEKLVAEIMTRIDVLAAKIGVGAEALWAILVKQAVISGWIELIFIIGTIAAWPLFLRSVRATFRHFESAKTSEETAMVCFAGCVVFGIALAILTIAAVFSVGNVVTAFANPEYAALQSLAKVAK